MRSSDFMQKLNQTVRAEIDIKTKKLEKSKGPKKVLTLAKMIGVGVGLKKAHKGLMDMI